MPVFPVASPSRAGSWRGGETAVRGTSRNVSIGGIRFVSDADLPLGAAVELSFGADGIEVRLRGVVRRCERRPEGDGFDVAVEFSEPDPAQRAEVIALAPETARALGGWQNRQYVRVATRLPIEVKAGWLGRRRAAATEDLSVGGLRYRTDAPPEIGARLRMWLRLPSGQTLRLKAVAVDVAEGASGEPAMVSVKFVSLPAQAREAIGAYVVAAVRPDAGAPS